MANRIFMRKHGAVNITNIQSHFYADLHYVNIYDIKLHFITRVIVFAYSEYIIAKNVNNAAHYN